MMSYGENFTNRAILIRCTTIPKGLYKQNFRNSGGVSLNSSFVIHNSS